ncbi:MAG: hypothetical protein O2829_00775 [Bacteroidetes bacterium]|nr:hypothetical protein [Bacteroidota bacterium]MDA1267619.1 hypothetical protein [Bacteroidota bacterium]
MSSKAPVLTPDLIQVLKIFLGSALGIVVLLSFFDGYRANNTGKDRSFQAADADRLFFVNLRSIHYDREIRQEADMELFRHGKRSKFDTIPRFFPALLLPYKKYESYLFFELEGADYPIQIQAKLAEGDQLIQIPFELSGNTAHKSLGEQLWPLLQQKASFKLLVEEKEYPLWQTESEKEVLKTVLTDYFRILNQPQP